MSAPQFHLQRVFDDGASSAVEVLPVLGLPADARMTRREFVGSGVSIASVLAAMTGCATGPEPPKPGPQAPARRPAPVLAHRGSVSAIAVSADGTLFASSGEDGNIKLWRLPSAQRVTTFADTFAQQLAFPADGRRLIAGGERIGLRIRFHDNTEPWTYFMAQNSAGVTAMTLSGDGKTLLTAHNQVVKSWDLGSRLDRQIFRTKARVVSLVASGDGKYLVAGLRQGTAIVFGLGEGKELRTLSGENSHFTALAITPDGRFLATPAGLSLVTLWSLTDGTMQRRSSDLKAEVWRMAAIPDGERIACGCVDGVVRIVGISRLEVSRELAGHRRAITALAAVPGGRFVISGDDGGSIAVWDLASGECLGYAFDPAANTVEGMSYNVLDRVTGQWITYTLPCGSPIPAGATCICNCVPGTYQAPAPASAPSRGRSGGTYCACDRVCSCVPVRRR